MARINLFALVAVVALLGVGTASASESNALSSSPVSAATNLVEKVFDEDNKEIQFFNSIFGDDDDDDYDEEQLKAREILRRSKHHHKHSRKKSSKKLYTIGADANDEIWDKSVQITWYAANDLKNPQCGNGGGSWQPENSCHIGAVVKNWSNGPQCGEFVKLCNKKAGNHCVKVRVIDKCAGCGSGHVDLTKSAFKKLSPSGTLTEGRIHGLQMYRSKKPNPWDLSLFGPFKLQ
ncbi:hypothetical protein IE53DRAFT_383294 [Violaceomyces palustris]|uniref:Uncharacterized protein n=1 Tax=Violaceomyces palustris TaxID=1673888 RepID=A0ACD0P7V5_9BASI|nr:hypothetical protein IE53DRAFT_383294 [Violaceomyces palustris]